jgi:hypothetical protein
MQIDWTASKVASGLDNKELRRKLANLLLSLDGPMSYSNQDHEIKGEIFAVLKEATEIGKAYLQSKYGEAVS